MVGHFSQFLFLGRDMSPQKWRTSGFFPFSAPRSGAPRGVSGSCDGSLKSPGKVLSKELLHAAAAGPVQKIIFSKLGTFAKRPIYRYFDAMPYWIQNLNNFKPNTN
jgi:hypothetical protein